MCALSSSSTIATPIRPTGTVIGPEIALWPRAEFRTDRSTLSIDFIVQWQLRRFCVEKRLLETNDSEADGCQFFSAFGFHYYDRRIIVVFTAYIIRGSLEG